MKIFKVIFLIFLLGLLLIKVDSATLSGTNDAVPSSAKFFSSEDSSSDDLDDDQEDSEESSSREERLFHYAGSLPYYKPSGRKDFLNFISDEYPLPFGGPLKEYDFVVVGAGSAGSVIASRLSEEGKWSVLVLEAGGPESLITDVPLLAAYTQSTDYNWGFRQEKQEGNCLGMEDQRCSWARGRAIGGTSVINYMIYTRGNKIDWDRIAAAGNPGWSYDEVLPYFLKSERANLKDYGNSTKHNKDGLLSIENIPHKSPLIDAFLEAAKELGNKIVDYNDGHSVGFGRVQAHTLNGRRHSAARAFLHPFRNRRNLHILPHSRVTKIHINQKTKTAKSVEYIRNKIKYKVKARKEIILSAGSMSSPQLLMLSGIGPKDHLEELQIPVIQDLPVGQNMYDHICFLGLPFTVNTSGVAIIESEVLNPVNILNWLNKGQGPFTLAGGVEGLGYIKTKFSDETANYPDMEFVFISGGLPSDKSGAIHKGMKVSEDFYQEVFGSITETPVFTIAPMIVHPKSKGYLKLKDNNPFHWPKFYYDYFSDRRDLDTMIEAIKYSIALSETKAFQKFGAKPHSKPYPMCKNHTYGSDEYWECTLRVLGATLYHQIGTCKMGPATDPEAVVDHELKVYGIQKLRVADSSIIPKPLTAHTHAPSVMVGEKMADILKKTWQE